MSKPRTLQDIAEICGVSRQAVSAALGLSKSNNTRISEEKAKAIQAVVKKYNFRPHRAAQRLQSRKHDSYGLLVSNLCRISMPTLVEMLKVVREQGKFIIIDSINEDAESSRFLSEDSVDGIITFEDLPDALYKKIKKSKIPAVSLNSNRRQGADAITYDEAAAVDQAIAYLKELGHEHIALIHKSSEHYSCANRVSAYRSACQRGDLSEELLFMPHGELEDEDLAAFIAQHPKLDAFILGHSGDAVCLYRVLQQLSQPLDCVGVVGFFWPGPYVNLRPHIATLSINQQQLGLAIADRLQSFINGDKQTQEIVLPYELNPEGEKW